MTSDGQVSIASSAGYFNSLKEHLELDSLLDWVTTTGLL